MLCYALDKPRGWAHIGPPKHETELKEGPSLPDGRFSERPPRTSNKSSIASGGGIAIL